MIKLAICDDDNISIQTAKRIVYETARGLKKQVEVDTYDNANGIIKRMSKKETLDILLLDIDMPNMTGLELAEKLRNSYISENELIIIFLR